MSELNAVPGLKIIAIDGGAASGKSSTSRAICERLHALHVDTGLHYRGVAFYLDKRGIEPGESAKIEAALEKAALSVGVDGAKAFMKIDGERFADADLRSERVNGLVSRFASEPWVRAFVKNFQRGHAELAQKEGFDALVMEGRDIGSVIFPESPYRFFLEADEATRIARRAKEGLTDAVHKRDELDKTRKTAPLVCPEGAHRIDNSVMTLEEVRDRILEIVNAE